MLATLAGIFRVFSLLLQGYVGIILDIGYDIHTYTHTYIHTHTYRHI